MPVAGRCYAVLGMMQDKHPETFVQPLLPFVHAWYTTGLQVERAGSAEWLAGCIGPSADGPVIPCASVQGALEALCTVLRPGDRVLVCGSFYTVTEWSALGADFT
jgi:dihydrofolate synthase/folylpolyglutamate synthase